MATIIAKSRVWLTADRSRVVADGDPDAAFLLAGAGGQVPPEYADAYLAFAAPPAKEARGSSDKLARGSSNKAASIEADNDGDID